LQPGSRLAWSPEGGREHEPGQQDPDSPRSRDNNGTRIVPRHIQLAARNDEELNKLLSGIIIASGRRPGAVPCVAEQCWELDRG
jgi:hypothetical protein